MKKASTGIQYLDMADLILAGINCLQVRHKLHMPTILALCLPNGLYHTYIQSDDQTFNVSLCLSTGMNTYPLDVGLTSIVNRYHSLFYITFCVKKRSCISSMGLHNANVLSVLGDHLICNFIMLICSLYGRP